MSIVKFSILSYYPSFVGTENIAIGIIYSVLDDNNVINKFEYIQNNWNRVKTFDDELNVQFMKQYLKGIKADVDSILGYGTDFKIENFIKYYVNEYKFSEIQIVDVADDKQFIDDSKKLYLRFDYNKNERLSDKKIKEYLNRLLRSSNITYTKLPAVGAYFENIQYDYILGQYAIKFFYLKEKSLSQVITSAKVWSYNAREMQDKYKSIFIYDVDAAAIAASKNKQYLDAILGILKENAEEVLPLNEGLDFIVSNGSN